MKKTLLAGLILAIGTLSASAQDYFCTSDEHNRAILQNDAKARQNRQELEDFTTQFQASNSAQRNSNTTIIIPVVFHILHQYGPENISDAQIHDEIGYLNRNYNKLNPDTNLVVADFIPIIANCGIEFRLAQLDPNGNCTNGIDRIVTPLTNTADDGSKLNSWPSDKYLNIWVAKSLANSGAAAYAYYPGTAPDGIDGIISRYDYIGGIGASIPSHANVITHEIGHYLNLSHVWGDTNSPGVACGDDHVNDTPITKGWTACALNAAICNPPIIENVQNYMEYSYCCHMFTEGQKLRMIATLNSFISDRNNLWSPSNLAATGLSGPPTVCAPDCDFYLDHKTVCENGTVHFYDLSALGAVSSYQWSFPGGVPSTSADSAPYVVYPSAGTYDATLTVTNATGTDTKTRTALVHVYNTNGVSLPYFEGFEDASTFPGNDGFILNEDNGITWSRVTSTHLSDSSCLRINNYLNPAGQIDEWVLPAFDFSNITTPINVTFSVANAQRNSSSTDKLQFFCSANCGTVWQLRWSKEGAGLSTAGISSVSFSPSPGPGSQWRQETANLNLLKLQPNVRLKFTNTSDRGNNTYIDDVNITGSFVNVDEAEDVQIGFAIYPNPTNSSSTIEFVLSKEQPVQLTIKDLLGKTIASVLNERLGAGYHTVSTPTLAKGIYMIDLVSGNKHHVRRLIVS
ncbi:MAG: T9SS type A sorting domain-containing protein [Bacteroidetes bacterium]|nr:T9SS type A sorting domain-containing protein [Bacteroidota bacterium]